MADIVTIGMGPVLQAAPYTMLRASASITRECRDGDDVAKLIRDVTAIYYEVAEKELRLLRDTTLPAGEANPSELLQKFRKLRKRQGAANG